METMELKDVVDAVASEEMLNNMALKLYTESGRTFRPMYPWVFVRVLPKVKTTVSGLYLMSTQNKPDAEGIVLATWKPAQAVPLARKDVDGVDWRASRSTAYQKVAGRESSVQAGDHVLFPYWAGLPVPGFDTDLYRVVKEEAWAKDGDGGIYAVIKPETAQDQLLNFLQEYRGYATPEALKASMEKQFIVMPRTYGSVTMSGK